ncbi:type III-B CRISPR module-associated protein Cmr5 [Pseudodesulfovibrio sp.]|uniref:type III-B CRISPR module-associated protein Cmr5 n=1 Tax=unclassified Pseudodesulfovibrio TaxID=2661612 RepID=UPI003B00B57B
MSNRTLEQRRAAFALRQITSHADSSDYGNYAGRVKSFPAIALANGLGQALASLLAKSDSDKGCKLLYEDLRLWMCEENEVSSPYFGTTDLLEALTNRSQDQYIQAQVELLGLSIWLKKFTQAYLSAEGD